MDFENTVDRGSAVILDADPRLCLSYVRIFCPKGKLGYRSFFSLSRYVNEFIQIISFLKEVHLNSGVRVIGIVLCYSHQACCLLYIWVKLTVAFKLIDMYQFTFEP